MPASVPPTFLRRNGTYRRGWSSWGKRQQLWCPYRRQTCKSGILPCTSLSNLLAGCSRVFLATIASSFENSSDGTLLNHRLDSLCADSWFAGSESDGSSYTIHGRPHHLPLPCSVWFIRSEMECLVWPDSPILDHGIADGILGRVYLSHNWFHCIPVEESETVMPALVSSSSPHVVFQVLWWNMCRLCTRLRKPRPLNKDSEINCFMLEYTKLRKRGYFIPVLGSLSRLRDLAYSIPTSATFLRQVFPLRIQLYSNQICV